MYQKPIAQNLREFICLCILFEFASKNKYFLRTHTKMLKIKDCQPKNKEILKTLQWPLRNIIQNEEFLRTFKDSMNPELLLLLLNELIFL